MIIGLSPFPFIWDAAYIIIGLIPFLCEKIGLIFACFNPFLYLHVITIFLFCKMGQCLRKRRKFLILSQWAKKENRGIIIMLSGFRTRPFFQRISKYPSFINIKIPSAAGDFCCGRGHLCAPGWGHSFPSVIPCETGKWELILPFLEKSICLRVDLRQ